MEITVISDERCQLGEGPLWDVAEQALYWVDSLAPKLFRFDQKSGTTRRWDLRRDPSAAWRCASRAA